jgi:predicted GNAT family N-acyltransferase
MKTVFTLLLSYLLVLPVLAQNSYESAMKDQIQAMQQIRSIEEAQSVSNAFLRIADVKKEEWLPLYYSAYVQTNAAFRFDVDKDQYFDQAMELVKKAGTLSANNSEITALEGFILMGKVSVDPANRGQSLSPQVMQLFGKAIAQNRENPRATTLMAQMELGMAQFFGSGPEKACGLARVGLDLFAKEESKVDENYLMPTWGKREAEQVASQCQ